MKSQMNVIDIGRILATKSVKPLRSLAIMRSDGMKINPIHLI